MRISTQSAVLYLRRRSISAAVRLTVLFIAAQRCYSCTSAFIQIIKLYAIANKMS